MTVIKQKAHSRFGLSSCECWIHCAGSVQLRGKVPNVTDSYAQEGNDAHAAWEEALTLMRDAGLLLADAVEEATAKFPKLRQDIIAFTFALEYVKEVWDATPNAQVYIEKKIDLTFIDPELWGRCDVLIVGDDVGHLLDYKWGEGKPVTSDYQIKAYGCSMLGGEKPPSKVYGHIIQPRLGTKSLVKKWEFSQLDLQDFACEMKRGVKLAETSGMLEAGTWCDSSFCGARAICPAYNAQVNELLEGEAPLEKVSFLDDAHIRTRYFNIPFLEKYVRVLKKYVGARLADGEPDHSLGMQQITRPYGVQFVENAENLPPLVGREDAWVLKSPAQLKKQNILDDRELDDVTEQKYKPKIIDILK